MMEDKMQVTYSGSNVTVQDGITCVKGRFIEEDSSKTLNAGTDTAFCRLVIEIDLSKENTEENLNQVSYKIIKGASDYPALTQTDIVRNNAGVYQFELASFKTSLAGITNFEDKRTYLDFKSIYNTIQIEFREVLQELESELAGVEDGSAYVLKSSILSGTEAPSDDIGSDGDLYVQYIE